MTDGRVAARRTALARGLIRELHPAFGESATLGIVLAGDEPAPGAPGEPAGATVADPFSPGAEPGPRATVTLRDPDAVGRLALSPTPDAFAEGFLRGDLDIHGDVVAAVEAGRALDLRRLRPSTTRAPGPLGARSSARHRRGRPAPAESHGWQARAHSPARDMAAVRFHYDVGDAFFGLWLDRRLDVLVRLLPGRHHPRRRRRRLDEAQEAKLDLDRPEAPPRARARLLDIGCGWGSLLLHAAERRLRGGRRHAQRAPGGGGERRGPRRRPGGPGRARRCATTATWRRSGPFDAVASSACSSTSAARTCRPTSGRRSHALRPGGLFLNHGIASTARGGRPRPRASGTSRFIDRFVFPDGELVPWTRRSPMRGPPASRSSTSRSLRPHYALTLAAWVARLESPGTRPSPRPARRSPGPGGCTWPRPGWVRAGRRGRLPAVPLARPGDDGPARRPLRPWW